MKTHRLVIVSVAFGLCSCGGGDPEGKGPPRGDGIQVQGGQFFGGVRRPTFQYLKEKEGGCADLYFHKGTADDREVLWIVAEKEKLALPAKGTKTFDLAAAPDGLQVAVDLWDKAPRFSAYCNDISPDTERESVWRAKKGKITLTVFESTEPKQVGPRRYKASVRLEGVVFEDDAGHQATLKEETITEVLVGWYAG
jgi:hypothetical protein